MPRRTRPTFPGRAYPAARTATAPRPKLPRSSPAWGVRWPRSPNGGNFPRFPVPKHETSSTAKGAETACSGGSGERTYTRTALRPERPMKRRGGQRGIAGAEPGLGQADQTTPTGCRKPLARHAGPCAAAAPGGDGRVARVRIAARDAPAATAPRRGSGRHR